MLIPSSPSMDNDEDDAYHSQDSGVNNHGETTLHHRKSPKNTRGRQQLVKSLSASESISSATEINDGGAIRSSLDHELDKGSSSTSYESIKKRRDSTDYDVDECDQHETNATNNLEVNDSGGIGPHHHHCASASASSSSSPLGKASLAVLVFYSVSGGPFGIESAVRSAGYFYTLLGFIIGPLIWSLQEALMTAELACVFPESSGGMAWVEEAFGPMAGWMSGYLGWMAGATDNSIYPVLFLDYLLQAFGSQGDLHPVIRFCGLGFTSICLAYINWLGLDIVGRMSIVICCVAMSPFVLMTIIGLFNMDWSRLFDKPNPNELELLHNTSTTDDETSGGFFPNAGLATTGILWRPFLNNLFWNLNSFDAGASFSAEVGNRPEQVIPPAMMYSVVLVVLSYLLPLIVAIGASDSQPYQWTDGYLATIARQIAGPWLEAWTIFAAGISNIAMFQAELSADSFQLMGMADRGHVPQIFAIRSSHGTPTYGIILGTIIIVGMGGAGLDKIIDMLNFNYSIALLMEYTAFISLRIYKPNLPRPWKIPLNTFGCILFFIPTYFFILLVLILSTYECFIFSLCTNIVGIGLYLWRNGYFQRSNVSRWMRSSIYYAPTPNLDDSVDFTASQRDGIMRMKVDLPFSETRLDVDDNYQIELPTVPPTLPTLPSNRIYGEPSMTYA